MKIKAVAALAIMMGTVLIASAAWATEPAAGSAIGPPPIARLIAGHVGRLLVLWSELGVTPEQRKEIHAVIKKNGNEIRGVAKSVLEKRRALRDSVLQETPNQDTIRNSATDLGKAIGDAAVLASKVVAEARKSLTPEQQERIKKFHAGCDQAENQWLTQMAK